MANLSDSITPISTSPTEGIQGDGNSSTPVKLDIANLPALGGAADPLDEFTILDVSTGLPKTVLASDLPGATGGEANTGSNVGTAGVGVFKQKDGVDLEFKKINSGSDRVSITDDGGNDEVDIDLVMEEVNQLTANSQSGTSYTLVLADAERKAIYMNNASANTVTIPTNASVAFQVGTVIDFVMEGAGATSIAGDTGVTINGVSAGSVTIQNQYGSCRLKKTSTNTWIASGDLFTSGGGGSGTFLTTASFLDSKDQYLSVADNASISTGDIDYSWSVWFKAHETETSQGIIGKDQDGNVEYRLWYSASDGWQAQVGNGTSGFIGTVDIGASVDIGQWNHVVFGHDTGNNQVFAYVNNGTVQTSATSNAAGDGGSPLYIGAAIGGSVGTGEHHLSGNIGLVAFWKKILSSGEVNTLYADGKGLVSSAYSGSLLTSLEATWDLDQTSTGQAPVSRLDTTGANNLTDNNNTPSTARGLPK